MFQYSLRLRDNTDKERYSTDPRVAGSNRN